MKRVRTIHFDKAADCFLDGRPATETGSLSTRLGYVLTDRGHEQPLSCTALIALMFRLRARNFRNRARAKKRCAPKRTTLRGGVPPGRFQ